MHHSSYIGILELRTPNRIIMSNRHHLTNMITSIKVSHITRGINRNMKGGQNKRKYKLKNFLMRTSTFKRINKRYIQRDRGGLREIIGCVKMYQIMKNLLHQGAIPQNQGKCLKSS